MESNYRMIIDSRGDRGCSSGSARKLQLWEYLHGNGSSKSSGGGVTRKEHAGEMTMPEFQKEFTVDIVFVIDSTGSMTPLIEKVKEVVSKVSSATLPTVDKDILGLRRASIGSHIYAFAVRP